MVNISKYTIRVEWSEEDDCYLAKCLEFPSLITHGDTRKKAIEELELVLEETINWMEEEDEKVPEPLTTRNYKGNISLRIPSDTHKEIAVLAAEKNISINQYITSLLEKNLYSDQISNYASTLKNSFAHLSHELESLKFLNHILFSEVSLIKQKQNYNFEETQDIITSYDIPLERYSTTTREKECNLSA